MPQPADPFDTMLSSEVLQRFKLDPAGMHGVPHWRRVRLIARRLGQRTRADPAVTDLFAILHDALRLSDDLDPGHGARAADWVHVLQGRIFNLPPSGLEALDYACRYHSDGLTAGCATVTTCWDADRLDLCRYDVHPNAALLCNDAAKDPEMVEWAYRLSHEEVPEP
jgi:uncharacterized protein